MKLIESDRPGPADDSDSEVATPPRPERRRVSVSLLLTISVLIGTVVTIYTVFPERHNLLMTQTLELHRNPPAFQLSSPSAAEVGAWGLALLDRDVPWPTLDEGSTILGATSFAVLNRRAALVRYRVGQDEVSLVVQRARAALPRQYHRRDGKDRVVSWRKGPWTFVAAGPERSFATWSRFVEAPQ